MTDMVRLRALLVEALTLASEVSSEPPEIIAAPVPANDPEPVSDTAAFAFRDHGAFYDWLRGNDMLGPKISLGEYSGCEAILKACAAAKWPISWTAYALATAYHETAHTMQPIHELGGPAYLKRMYDIQGARPAKARELGNLAPGDGVKYAGRGYVQLTGKTNYARAAKSLAALGIDADLVAQPNRAMEPDIAARIMIYGMAGGWFTSRKMPDDLPASGPASLRQFVLSRDIINGRDKDDEIAAYANDFQTALQFGGYLIGA